MDQHVISQCFESRCDDLKTRLLELNRSLRLLSGKLSGSLPGDAWLRQSCDEIQKRTSELVSSLQSNDHLFWGGRKSHPAHLLDIWNLKTQTTGIVCSQVLDWRHSLSSAAAEHISQKDLKSVFDYYFRYDLYGSLRNEDTLILSRGAKELPFFSPPAAVRIALDISNRNTWFGYSDSLGHIETREAVARLEGARRHDPKIRFDNVAVIQGGTQGLSYVLGFLHRQGMKGSFACVVPTYAPILDDVANHFGVVTVPLDENYHLEKSLLLRTIERSEVCGLLLSLPHNPPMNDGFSSEDLVDIAQRLSELGKYLIIDEVAYNSNAAVLSPIHNPHLIVVHSYSKMFAVAGLKVGHLLAHRDFIDQFYRFASSSYGSPPSFLYLTCTAINSLEYAYLTGSKESFSEDILCSVSDTSQLFEENRIWHLCEQLHSEVIDLLLERILMIRHLPSVSQIHPSEPGGCNKMVSLELRGSSYSTFLEILRRKNVSIFPIDCMMPVDGRHDIRITTSMNPNSLIQGFLACCEVTDDILARSCSAEWISEEDKVFLDRFGLYDISHDFFGYGHAMRVVFRLRQILALEGISQIEFLERSAALHDIGKVWSRLDQKERTEHWRRLFGFDLPHELLTEERDSVWGSYIMEYADKAVDGGHAPSKEVRIFLQEFFHAQVTAAPGLVEYALLDIADQTSDFGASTTLTWNALSSLLSIKAEQLKVRYLLDSKTIEEHITRSSRKLQHCRAGLLKLKNWKTEKVVDAIASNQIG